MQLWFREPLTWLALVLPLFIAVVWATAFYFFKVVPVTEWKVSVIDNNGEREEGRERGREMRAPGEGKREREGQREIFHYFPALLFQLTPAESRELNKECTLLGFYDNHDIWHFLSAVGMFLAFLVSRLILQS